MLIANRYELHEQIGVGGMGTVFRGIDTQSGETVAIKQLRLDAAAHDSGLLQRFQREAEALRQLNHPSIVKVMATADQDNQHFIIMEHMGGGSLRELLINNTLPVPRVLSIALDLADALTRTHRLDIIHRDLKPANVLMADDGTPRLTDFGIAHMGGMERMTESNSLLGTMDYLPPEALLGEAVDSRADIWSFGVMLFEMLTGKRPFKGGTAVQTMTAILTQPVPDLETLRPDCPMALVDLVYRMLEKNREARISSVRLVGAELESILAGKQSSVKQSSASLSPPVEDGATTIGAKRFELPSIKTVEKIKHNLPAQTTPFVGRDDEISELIRLLDDFAVRLVTILAPGGMGKTRLALEVATHYIVSTQTGVFHNGVCFVSLAPLTSAENIVTAVAEAVGFQFYPGGEPQQQLLDFLREKHLLLLMDNFEHLLDGVSLVNDILQTAPGVKIIATSRQRLNLSSETVFNLGGMDFPDWETPEDALEYTAVKLFMQSAKRVMADFELTADDLKYVAKICRVVQGMPLAILLAAAWVEALSLKEITEEIDKSLDFLETEMHDIPARQRSIRAVFDYSWNLLNDNERLVFSKVSVFRGGFTREAAQMVIGAGLRDLAAMVNKSLLRRNPDNGRYELHELLRQYGEDKLEKSGERGMVRDAHSAYFADFMKLREADLEGKRQTEAGQEIDTDFENIRQAWYYTVAQGQIERLGQFLYALNLIAYQHKRYSELFRLFDDAVEALRQPFGEHRNYGRLLVLYGQCLDGLGQMENAENQLRRALAIAQTENDAFGIALASLWLARVIDPDLAKRQEAWQLCEDSIHIFKEQDEGYELANALHYQGYLLWVEDKHPESLELNRQVLEVRRRLGDDIGVASSLYNIVGSLYFTNPIEAETQAKEVLEVFKRLNQPYGIAGSLSRLVSIEQYKGNLETARLYAEEAFEIARESGVRYIIADVLVQLAWINIATDRFHEAEEAIAQDKNTEDEGILAEHALIQCFIYLGLQDWTPAKHRLIVNEQLTQGANVSEIPTMILAMGLIAAVEGHPEHALELISWVINESTINAYRKHMPLVKRCLENIKIALSEEAYAAAWERGKTFDLETRIAELLNAVG